MMRTGLTLALFDQKQRHSMPLSYFPTIANEAAIHFYARYRAITERITTRRLHSVVWFPLVYP
ncbi:MULTISPECIES: hypothetical protein [Enterobacteriaceae]|uniref:hypothetical protein n=1 Tax=Enterobacteriaceae TaxID=543 RepID=UPI00034F2214|nr:hypothetical protein [Enterobacter sp. R4-368]AGN87537.1 hypothetical protein H650_21155 [Enterobacter sp. R4-368]